MSHVKLNKNKNWRSSLVCCTLSTPLNGLEQASFPLRTPSIIHCLLFHPSWASVNIILRPQWLPIYETWKTCKNVANWEKTVFPLFCPILSVRFTQWVVNKIVLIWKRKWNRTTVIKKAPWLKYFRHEEKEHAVKHILLREFNFFDMNILCGYNSQSVWQGATEIGNWITGTKGNHRIALLYFVKCIL